MAKSFCKESCLISRDSSIEETLGYSDGRTAVEAKKGKLKLETKIAIAEAEERVYSHHRKKSVGTTQSHIDFLTSREPETFSGTCESVANFYSVSS